MDVHTVYATCYFDAIGLLWKTRAQLASVRDFAIVPLSSISPIIGRSAMTLNVVECIACTNFLTSLAIFSTGMPVAWISIYRSTQKHYRDSIIRYLACFRSLFIGSHFRIRYRNCNLEILRGKIKKWNIFCSIKSNIMRFIQCVIVSL